MYCPRCEKEVAAGAQVCSNCSADFSNPEGWHPTEAPGAIERSVPPFFFMYHLAFWYAVLCVPMVVAKFMERPTAGGDGFAYISNVLALVLLEPWFLILSDAINTPGWFLALSVANLVLLIGVSIAMKQIMLSQRSRRLTSPSSGQP